MEKKYTTEEVCTALGGLESNLVELIRFMLQCTPQTITLADYIKTASDRGQTAKEAEADFKESALQNVGVLGVSGNSGAWHFFRGGAKDLMFLLQPICYRLPYTNGKLPEWKVLDVEVIANDPIYEGGRIKFSPIVYGPSGDTFAEAAHAWNNEARSQEGK